MKAVNRASSRDSNSNDLRVLVYDDHFEQYYHQLPLQKRVHRNWICLSTLCLALFTFLVYVVVVLDYSV